MVTLMFLIASILGLDMLDMLVNRGADITGIETPKGPAGEAQRRLQLLVVENLKVFYFLMIIFQSIWLKVYFRKSGYNLLEHSVLVFFVTGHLYWLSILDMFVLAISGLHINSIVTVVISILFFAYATMNLYSNKYRIDKSEVIVKGVLAYLTAYLTFTIFIAIVSLAWFLIDPEMRELVRPSNNR